MKKPRKKYNKPREHFYVSEHAILRYIERVMEVNIDEVVSKIMVIAPKVAIVGDGNFPVGNGCIAVVKNNAIVTIKPSR